MSYTDYEKHHLHDYVDKKGSSYTKQEVDNKVASLKSEITTLIQSSIQTALNKFSSDMQKAMIRFRNNQSKNRVGRKALVIPKTNYTWIKLLDASEIDGVSSLNEVLIQNIYIRRNDRYFHAKSSHVANAFTNLEFFFNDNFSKYYCYFDSHPSSWNMDCFIEYIKIPKEIPVENSNEDNE